MMPTDVSLDKCRLRTIGSRILATLSCLESLAIAHLPPCDASPNVQMQVFQPVNTQPEAAAATTFSQLFSLPHMDEVLTSTTLEVHIKFKGVTVLICICIRVLN